MTEDDDAPESIEYAVTAGSRRVAHDVPKEHAPTANLRSTPIVLFRGRRGIGVGDSADPEL